LFFLLAAVVAAIVPVSRVVAVVAVVVEAAAVAKFQITSCGLAEMWESVSPWVDKV
jgi:hypothetical protein